MKLYFLLGLLGTLCLTLFAQSDPKAPNFPLKSIAKELSQASQNPKIMPETKKLLESTRGFYNLENSARLTQKLKTKGNLIIRIFGDSHIAGDFISHQLRGLLFSQHTPGFIYPLYPSHHQNIALSYQSSNFEILNSQFNDFNDYPMGGVVAKPMQLPASITLSPKAPLPKDTLTKLIFKAPDTKSALLLTDSTNAQFKVNAKRGGAWQILSLRLKYPVRIEALNDKVLLGGAFIARTENVNHIVENIGINGARSDLWLRWNQDLFKEEMRILPADLVILCYGSNDTLLGSWNETTFLRNYRALLAQIKATNPNATLLLISPPPVVQKIQNSKKPSYKLAKNFKAVKNAIHKLAKEEQVLLFDLDEFIKQSGGKKQWELAGLAKTDVHLLPTGYKLVADKIYYELGRLK